MAALPGPLGRHRASSSRNRDSAFGGCLGWRRGAGATNLYPRWSSSSLRAGNLFFDSARPESIPNCRPMQGSSPDPWRIIHFDHKRDTAGGRIPHI